MIFGCPKLLLQFSDLLNQLLLLLLQISELLPVPDNGLSALPDFTLIFLLDHLGLLQLLRQGSYLLLQFLFVLRPVTLSNCFAVDYDFVVCFGGKGLCFVDGFSDVAGCGAEGVLEYG